MKVSGFFMIRNGVSFDYPFMESLRSLDPLVDELIICIGKSDDSTREKIVREFSASDRVKIIETQWPLDDEKKKKSGLILSEQTNIALQACTGDWCLHVQADEILHEKDYPALRSTMCSTLDDSKVEALLFDYTHFYGSYDVVQKTRSAYRREVRAVKRSANAVSIGDAQSFRKKDGSKLQATFSGARMFHYGWVRPPEVMKSKTQFMDKLYHGEDEGSKPNLDNYRYKKIWGLTRFADTHPKIMHERILAKGWEWDFEKSPLEWRFKDWSKVLLDTVENITGHRFFEYRSYCLSSPTPLIEKTGIVATLIVSTYQMPRHLDLVCAALETQSTTNFEVIICDDGSGPETKEIASRFKNSATFPVQYLWQEDKGFRKCKILNEAIRKSHGEILVFLDGDCIPHRHYVRDHIENQSSSHYLAGRRVELGQEISNWLSPAKIRAGFLNWPRLRVIFSGLAGKTENLQRTLRVPWHFLRRILGMTKVDDMKGCNYSAHRSSFLEINGFDEKYEGYGREDTDVEIRFQKLGLKIKSLKGLALQYHVWHPRREFTPANDDRLEQLKKQDGYRCDHGVQVPRTGTGSHRINI